MTWRPGELWLDTDVLWFREAGGAFGAAIAVDALKASLFAPAATGLEASRQRRQGAEAARRRKRLATRTVPAVALVVGSATMLPIAWLRHGEAARGAQPLQEDPPSLTFHLDRRGADGGRRRACAPLGRREPESRPVSRRRPGRPTSRTSSGAARGPSASGTPAVWSTARSSRSVGRTGSPGTRSRTASRISPAGFTATSTRSGRYLRDRRLPRRAPERAAGRSRRHQPARRRPDRRPRLAPERLRRRHLLPAARPSPPRPDRGRARSTTGSPRICSSASSAPARR